MVVQVQTYIISGKRPKSQFEGQKATPAIAIWDILRGQGALDRDEILWMMEEQLNPVGTNRPVHTQKKIKQYFDFMVSVGYLEKLAGSDPQSIAYNRGSQRPSTGPENGRRRRGQAEPHPMIKPYVAPTNGRSRRKA